MCDVNVSKGGDESMTDGDYQPALDVSALPQVGTQHLTYTSVVNIKCCL